MLNAETPGAGGVFQRKKKKILSLFFFFGFTTREPVCAVIGFNGWKSTAPPSGPVRSGRSLKVRRKGKFSRQVLLITVAGLQGERPLIDKIMWITESRQNGSVTLGIGIDSNSQAVGVRVDVSTAGGH